MSKKNKKTLIIAVVVLALLLVLYAVVTIVVKNQEKKKEAAAEQQEEASIVLSIADTDISELSFMGEDGEITFVQENGIWSYPEDDVFVMSEAKRKIMTNDLAALSANRRLEDQTDLSQFGLDHPLQTVTVRTTDGEETSIYIGNVNDSTSETYFQLEKDSSTVYLTSSALASHFGGKVSDYAAYDDFPSIQPEDMREFDVTKAENSYVLTMTGDDKCTVTDEDGDTQSANLNILGTIQDNISNISWLSHVEYHCQDFAAYGLEEPRCVIEITWDESETAQGKVTLNIGDQDEKGNYYVRLDDSCQVGTVRQEYLLDLLENKASSYWSLTYSFVSISDLSGLTVTADGETHVLTAENVEDGTGETTRYLLDGQDVGKEPFTDFYYACVSVTAQERMKSVPEDLGEPVLTLHYELTDGSTKDIVYYPGDQNFYTVIYENGTKAASTNKLYVNTMLEDLNLLLNQ